MSIKRTNTIFTFFIISIVMISSLGMTSVAYADSGPLPLGKYDDTNPAWNFSGTWTAEGAASSYNNTLHYSGTTNDYAEVTIDGPQVILTYTGYPNRGDIDVYVDGAKVDTFSQYASTLQWQKTWTSADLGSGSHTIKFVLASAGYIDIDAIEVVGPDTTDPASIADLGASTGALNGTVALSWTAPGDDAGTGTASSYEVRYSSSAISDETAWTNATGVSSGIPTPQIAGSNESMVVGGLTPGSTYYFSVRAVDEAVNRGGLSNSPSAVSSTYTGLPPGKYDDTNAAWAYSSGAWVALPGAIGAYNDTLHYSGTTNDYAEIAIDGSQVILSYTGLSNRGDIDVYVDGAKVDTFSQYASTLQWQKTWTSADLGSGSHTLKFVLASAGYIDIDAIEVVGPDTTDPASIADLDASTGALNGTVALSWTAPGDDAGTGTASSYEVRYSSSAISDETAWTNATGVSSGIPTPQIAGSNESMVVGGLTPGSTYYFSVRAVDEAVNRGGLSNSPSAVSSTYTGLPPGKYDDTNAAWAYSSGAWVALPGAIGAYNDTLHYSGTTNDYAEIAIDGSQVILSYTGLSNRGDIDVYVDGAKVDTFSQYASTLQWQETWTSADLGAGSHTLKFVLASAGYFDLDAIEVLP